MDQLAILGWTQAEISERARISVTLDPFEAKDPSEFGAIKLGGPLYRRWRAKNEALDDADRAEIAARLRQLPYRPLISIILAPSRAGEEETARTISSIPGQLYSNWELLAGRIDGAQPWESKPEASDDRIRLLLQEPGSSRTEILNSGLKAARGEFFVVVHPGDAVPVTALYLMVEEINAQPNAVIIYGDEDRIDSSGELTDPHFKPDWNLDLFYGVDYLGRFVACRTAVALSVGGFRTEFDAALRYDLLLRVIERIAPADVRHVPSILYHRCGATVAESDANPGAARRALEEHFARLGHKATRVVPAPDQRIRRIIRPVPDPSPLVSLVMPTGGNLDILPRAVAGILSETDYANIELILLYNSSTHREAFAYFEDVGRDRRVSIVDAGEGFSFPRIVNRGAEKAAGDLLCLVNDDIAIVHPGWLSEMVSHGVRPEVGAVGAMLYYPDDTIQHAGVILGLGAEDGVAGHIHRNLPRGGCGYFHRAALTQALSCVTAACLVVRRDVYWEVGGFDERLEGDFNDVDFCIALRNLGYLIVWTPFAELYHWEARTRGQADTPAKQKQLMREGQLIKAKWGAPVFDWDPYFNPNLRRASETYALAEAPRIARPWRATLADPTG